LYVFILLHFHNFTTYDYIKKKKKKNVTKHKKKRLIADGFFKKNSVCFWKTLHAASWWSWFSIAM